MLSATRSFNSNKGSFMRTLGTVPFEGDQSVKATAGRDTQGVRIRPLGRGHRSTSGTQRRPTRPEIVDGGPLL